MECHIVEPEENLEFVQINSHHFEGKRSLDRLNACIEPDIDIHISIKNGSQNHRRTRVQYNLTAKEETQIHT